MICISEVERVSYGKSEFEDEFNDVDGGLTTVVAHRSSWCLQDSNNSFIVLSRLSDQAMRKNNKTTLIACK